MIQLLFYSSNDSCPCIKHYLQNIVISCKICQGTVIYTDSWQWMSLNIVKEGPLSHYYYINAVSVNGSDECGCIKSVHMQMSALDTRATPSYSRITDYRCLYLAHASITRVRSVLPARSIFHRLAFNPVRGRHLVSFRPFNTAGERSFCSELVRRCSSRSKRVIDEPVNVLTLRIRVCTTLSRPCIELFDTVNRDGVGRLNWTMEVHLYRSLY